MRRARLAVTLPAAVVGAGFPFAAGPGADGELRPVRARCGLGDSCLDRLIHLRDGRLADA